MKEDEIQTLIRIKASELGMRLWRNNVGAGKLENGSFIRWGLCNDSPEINKRIKSADLIGIKPVLITQDMVGTTIGQFVSIECKNGNWQSCTTEREKAQMKWANLVMSFGGIAKIINKVEDFK